MGSGVRSLYGIIDNRWRMQLRRAHSLSSAFTTYQGACLMSVYWNISSLAFEYSTHLPRDSRSMGLSFHRFVGFSMRDWNRFSCSSSLTENQYLRRMIPERTSIRSNSGQECMNSM